MDALAAAAGVTTGSLYKHFEGKSDLFAALIEAELDRSEQRFAAVSPEDPSAIDQVWADYLSLQHVNRPERGCVLPSLTSEVATAGPAARASFEEGLLRIHAIIERWTGSSEKAWALIAQNVGAVMLARAMRDEKVQQRLLTAVERDGKQRLAERRRPA
jgi:AcrR family transcriptional regulator